MLAKKGSRNITIGEIAFRWKVSATDSCLSVVAELRDDPKGRLAARLPYPKPGEPEWQVTPGLVADIIREGLDAGWLPGQRGDFELHSTAKLVRCSVAEVNDSFTIYNLTENELRAIYESLLVTDNPSRDNRMVVAAIGKCISLSKGDDT